MATNSKFAAARSRYLPVDVNSEVKATNSQFFVRTDTLGAAARVE
jgi:hypothetical protein